MWLIHPNAKARKHARSPQATGAERKAFAAEVGRLILKLRENSNSDSIPIWNDTWLLELAEKSGMGKSSAYNWWAAFTKSANLSITPKQATDENRQAFFAWLDERRGRPKQGGEDISQNFGELFGKKNYEVAADKAGFGNAASAA